MPTNFDTFMPFDAGAGANVTEDGWRAMARHWLRSGVLLEDNFLEVFGDDSGLQVKVRTGKCFIRGHYAASTSEKTIGLAAADPTNPRIDRLVARLDPTNNRIELDRLTGTPAGSPAAPALTQSASGIWEESLAQISVPATDTSIAAGQVTDERTYSGAFEPSAAQVLTEETRASSSYGDPATAGPAVTVTTGKRALVTLSCQVKHNTAAGVLLKMGVTVSGASSISASDDFAAIGHSPVANYYIQLTRRVYLSSLTPGSNVFTAKYASASGTGSFLRREIIVEPLP